MNNGAHERTDAIVVGGGLAGLTAATYLARAGKSVTVLERASQLGGRAMTTKAGEFSFNLGPHALYRKGAGNAVLKELDIRWTGKLAPASGYASRDGKLHTVSYAPWWFLTNSLLAPAAKLGMMSLFPKMLRAKPAELAHETIGSWIERSIGHPQLRQLMHALVRVATYANAPDMLSAQVALFQLQTGQRGVYYIDGGWQTLVDGLQCAAAASGARIEHNAAATRVDRDAEGCVIRLADGSVRHAASVIVAAPIDVAAQLLPGTLVAQRPASSTEVRAACLDVGLRRLTRPEVGFSLGLDAPTYYSVHSRTAKLAPDGAAMIHIAKYLAPDDRADSRDTQHELEGVLDLTQPGWRDEVIEQRYLPNMAVVSAMATAQDGGFDGRLANDAPGIPGVFVAGDWVGNEGWLVDGVLSSAKRSAQLAIDHAERTPNASVPSLVGATSGWS